MTSEHPPGRRVTLLAAEFPPIGGGGVIRMAKLAKYLPTLGWDVTVVSSNEPLAHAVDETLLADIPSSVRILRLGSPLWGMTARATSAAKSRFRRESLPFQILFRVRAIVRVLLAIPDRWIAWAWRVGRLDRDTLGDPDVILTSGPPHSTHLAGVLVARRLDVPFVMDLRDEWTPNPYYQAGPAWRRLVDRRLERLCIGTAHRVLFVSETSRGRYASRYPGFADRFVVVPNGFDPMDFEGPWAASRRIPPGGTLTFGHAGSLQDRRDASPFLRAFGSAARSADGRLHLRLVGSISAEQEQIARSVIPAASLTIEDFMPHREALRRMAECDVLLVLSNHAEAGPAALTGKIFEWMALRRPILAVIPRGPATALLEEIGTGVWADPSDEPGIIRAIDEAVKVATSGSSVTSDAVLARYDRRRQADQVSDLLDQLRTVGQRAASERRRIPQSR